MQSFLRQGCLEGKVMDDLISREAILKHIEKIRQDMQMMDDTYRASIVMTGMHLCERVVRSQPSAQSEIIRCKDCKHNDIASLNDANVLCNLFYGCWQADDYCSHGERKDE